MEIKFNISINLLIFIIMVATSVTSVALTLLFTKVVINLQQGDNVKEETCKKSTINITIKDMAYWIFFLIMLGILWGSSHIYENKTFSEYVSFSGTVTSILLGLVAIVYSFFQSADNASTQESLQGVLNELKASSQDIKHNTDTVKKITNDMSEIPNTIDEMVKKVNIMSDKVSKSIDSLNSRLEGLEIKIERTNNTIEKLSKKNFEPSDWK